MRFIITIWIIFLCSGLFGQELEWAFPISSNGEEDYDEITHVKIDQGNNMYICGYFNGIVDFDPFSPPFFLPPDHLSLKRYLFLAKYDSLRNIQWVDLFASNKFNISNLELDGAGNPIISGYPNGYSGVVIDLDPSENNELVYEDEIFISKYDPDGNYIWHGTINNHSTSVQKIITDSSEDFIVFYSFNDSINVNLKGVTSMVYGDNYKHSCFVKYSSEAEIKWSFPYYTSADIEMNDNGEIAIAGNYDSSYEIDLDPNDTIDCFFSNPFGLSYVTRFNSNGIYQNTFVLNRKDYYDSGINDVIIDNENNIYSIFFLYTPIDIDPGPVENIIQYDGSVYSFSNPKNNVIAKYNNSNELEWFDIISGHSSVYFNSFDDMHLYIYGSYTDSQVDLNSNNNSINETMSGGPGNYIARYDTNGDLDWYIGQGGDIAYTKHIYAAFNALYICGSYYSDDDLDLNPLTVKFLFNYGYSDGYVLKYTFFYSGITTENKPVIAVAYPNPSSDFINIKLSNNTTKTKIELFDCTGKLILLREMNKSNETIDVSNIKSGYYLMLLTNSKEVYNIPVIIE
ncbi:MAG: hypothetical protein A2W91_12715 [Bacteroidetes bacterium GWF2_38_335]|nr:MAG: hypothetical protein A2W91_12715 [Bacteroidetes bacterium GWF2_38_335]OFY77029.1 MAG: hypothetical protein A2281_00830 [Bacteroidetes bacterium RIFOXYA12_FULL_38_20]HBS86887.1 hypothetical protein [Bacteroidales bacterium]